CWAHNEGATRQPVAGGGPWTHHWSMAAIPTLEEEGGKRPTRERQSLGGGRTRIVNRFKSCLVRAGIRGLQPKIGKTAECFANLRTPEGAPIPPNTLEELKRDTVRLRLVRDQIKEIDEARLMRLQAVPQRASNAMVLLLARILSIGVETADMLVREVLSR